MKRSGRAVVATAIAAATAAIAIAGLAPGAGAAGEDGKAVFDRLCAGCHTIGGGPLAGPDLAGLADRRERAWAERFILDPAGVIASGDPIATQLVDEYGTQMPDLGVTQAQIGPLLQYFGFAEATPEPGPEPTPEPAPSPAAGDAASGKRLFQGSDRFDAGGPSCLSCHSVAGVGALGGGALGPDLTGAYDKYGGEQGLQAALETVAFPTMAPIFTRKQLTAGERADLVAFLSTAAEQQRAARAAGKLVGLAVAAAAVIALLAMAVWRRRLAGVRKPLVNRATGR